MPFVSLKLRPGVNVEATAALNEAGVSGCNLIRYKAQLPQKMGGWTKFYSFAVSGAPRALHAWKDLSDNERLAIGTTTQLGVVTAGALNVITPQSMTTDSTPSFETTSGDAIIEIIDAGISDVTTFDAIFLNTPIAVGGIVLHGVYQISAIIGAHTYQIVANENATSTVSPGAGDVPEFDTASGSPIVTVTLPAHGRAVGDRFTFPLATDVGGVTISGTYVIQSVPTADTFTISTDVQAGSTASASMNGGGAQIVYYISLGPSAAGIGYGLGGYGEGGYGTGVVPAGQTGSPIAAGNWSHDNWGEILISCPRNGGIYAWAPNSGYETAIFTPTAPIFNGGCFVAMPEQILVCWGSTSAAPGATTHTASPEQRDPLIVRWSDALDYTNFSVNATTQAGSYRIPSGSEIVGGMQGPQQAVLWTDIDVWAMQYLGPPLIFGFNKLSSGCGLVAQHAAAVMRGVIAWMGPSAFFMLSGGSVQEIPCPVWDVVFQDLDTANQNKIVAGANSQFSEFIWFYPSLSGGTGEPDKYVKVNVTEGMVWDYGTLARSAWIDQSVLGGPIGAAPSGIIYQHESGNDDDMSPMSCWFETGWFALEEGSDFISIDRFDPDMKWGLFNGSQDANVAVTIMATNYPNDAVRSYGPYVMTQAKTHLNTRVRGRLAKLRFESSDAGSFWRLGNMRYRAARDGRR